MQPRHAGDGMGVAANPPRTMQSPTAVGLVETDCLLGTRTRSTSAHEAWPGNKTQFYTDCLLQPPSSNIDNTMFTKYNLLPDACHFSSFSVGEGKALHYSYTPTTMYCKCEITIDKKTIVYVEMRELDQNSLEKLNSMSTDDHIGPMQVFGNLPGNGRSQQRLDDAISSYSMSISSRDELKEKCKALEPNSDEYIHVDALLGHAMDEKQVHLKEIELITAAYNNESGYDLKTKSINPL